MKKYNRLAEKTCCFSLSYFAPIATSVSCQHIVLLCVKILQIKLKKKKSLTEIYYTEYTQFLLKLFR